MFGCAISAFRPCPAASRRRIFYCQAKKAATGKASTGKKEGKKSKPKALQAEVPADAPTSLIVVDDFLPAEEIDGLRGVFDERFRDPRRVHAERFCWDYWHVPNQYTLLRTPANDFFPEDVFEQLESQLLRFGQERLGCGNISPVWLSAYVHGCRQEMHADLPHGPWAFVLSVTLPPPRKFTGGETFILRPHVLDYWRGFDRDRVVEAGNLMEWVEPLYNRLTVFDSRYPHGVRVVEGTHDPREGRLVLHGWFLDAAPFFAGSLPEEVCVEPLNDCLEPLYERLAEMPLATGMVTVALDVAPDGSLEQLRWLSDTLVVAPEATDDVREARKDILGVISGGFSALRLPAAEDGGKSCITVPLVFG